MSNLNRRDFKALLTEWSDFISEGIIKVDEHYLNSIFKKCIALNVLLESDVNKEVHNWAESILEEDAYFVKKNVATIFLPNDSLTINVYNLENSKIADAGEYNPYRKTLSLNFKLFKKALTIKKINKIIETKSIDMYSTLKHEYMHHLQVIKSKNKDTYFGLNKKISTKDDKDYEKVNSNIHSLREVEFYPKLYTHIAYYEKNEILLNNETFKNFLYRSEFFRSLKYFNKKAYKKAVGILYNELQNSKKVIKAKSKNLTLTHVNILIETIDMNTDLYDKIESYCDFDEEKTFVFMKFLFEKNYLDIKKIFEEDCKELNLEVLEKELDIEELIKVTSYKMYRRTNSDLQVFSHRYEID
jgi:hypothetical protein